MAAFHRPAMIAPALKSLFITWTHAFQSRPNNGNKLLRHLWYGRKARVGIGRFTSQLRGHLRPFPQVIKHNPPLPKPTDSSSFGVRFGVRFCGSVSNPRLGNARFQRAGLWERKNVDSVWVGCTRGVCVLADLCGDRAVLRATFCRLRARIFLDKHAA